MRLLTVIDSLLATPPPEEVPLLEGVLVVVVAAAIVAAVVAICPTITEATIIYSDSSLSSSDISAPILATASKA